MPEPRSGGRRRVYLVRHGDVDYFGEGGLPVRPDLVSLNEAGRREAAALRDLLADCAIDRAVSSGLPRTEQTAAIVCEGHRLDVETHEALREVRPGRLADFDALDLPRVFLEAFGTALTRESRFLGGERLGDFLDRVLPCFRDLVADPDWTELLIVAHGGVNRAVLGDVLGCGLAGFGAFEQDPAALNVIDVAVDDSGSVSGIVRLLNHTPYDGAKRHLRLTTMERLLEQWRGAAPG